MCPDCGKNSWSLITKPITSTKEVYISECNHCGRIETEVKIQCADGVWRSQDKVSKHA